MGGKSTNTVQKENSAPWIGQQPYLTGAFEQAQQQFNNPNSTIAGLTPDQQQAQGMQRDLATGMMPQLVGQQNAAWGSQLSAADVNNNPYLPQVVEGAIKPVTDTLMKQWLPGIRSEAIGGGMYGSSRQGIAEGNAIQGAYDTASQRAAEIMSGAYDRGLQTQTQALALAPQLMQANAMPSQLLQGIGAQDQQLWQALLDEPANRLNTYAGLVGGNQYGRSGSVSSNSPSDPLMGAVGGGMLGYSLGPALGMTGPWGALAGAVMGGVMS